MKDNWPLCVAVGVVVLVTAIRVTWTVATESATSEVITLQPSATPVEQLKAPPCIHEVCAERPVRLRCENGGGYWPLYHIEYERLCDARSEVMK